MGQTGEGGAADATSDAVPMHIGDSAEVRAAIAADVTSIGAACRPGVLDEPLLSELRDFVDQALAADLEWHAPDDLENEGRVTFLPRYGELPLGLLDHEGVMDPVVEILGPDAEMYTMTTACQGPGGSGRDVHVDAVNQPPGFVLALGALVLLDDFTETSGPTRFLPDITPELPEPDDFDARARRLLAPAGSVCWFNAGCWHDVLPNQGTSSRRAILIAMGRSGLRPRFDVVRMLSHLDLDALPHQVRRRLGLLSLPPGTYEEYYLPDSRRAEEILRAAMQRR